MKKTMALTAIGTLLLVGCNSIPVSKNAAEIGVDFGVDGKIQKKYTCDGSSRGTSPVVTLTNVPAGTKFLKFRMVDWDFTSYNHGNETLAYTGSVIPEGGLKSYSGPCPPSQHRYEMTFEALNADKTLILGKGAAMRMYP